MRLVLSALLLVVFAAAPALSQDAYSSSTRTARALASSPSFAFAAAQPAPPRVLDSRFLLLTGIAAAATVADVVTTSQCLAASLSCQESNPLVGSRPSTGKLYGFAISTLGAQVAISALLRHHNPQSRSWMIPPIAAAAAHGTAAVLNQRRTSALTSGAN
jgi:hypothetical protein